MIGEYCREYRISKGITLNEMSVTYEVNLKTLSAFEHGRSSNIRHLAPYVLLSEKQGDKETFLNGLAGAL